MRTADPLQAVLNPVESESATVLLERRWFAAAAAAKAAAVECAVLRQVTEMAQSSFRAAHTKLETLETLRDVLEAELMGCPAPQSPHTVSAIGARCRTERPAA